MGVSLRWMSLAAGVALAASLAGCASAETGASAGSDVSDSSSAPSTSSAASPSAIQPLPTGIRFDYQLGGSYPPPAGVRIVTRDSTSKPAAGLYNICYINGFQTQSEDKSFWLTKHPTLVLRYSNGKPVFDPGWPDEMILDVSTRAKRTAIATVLAATIDECKSKGFEAVEFDNLDSYSRSHKMFTLTDDLDEAELLVAKAHSDGLAAGQKNTDELGTRGRDDAHFDFAVSEECYKYDECAQYTKVYGAKVLDIEYTDDLRGTFAQDCKAKQIPAMTILRDANLVTPKSKHYVYDSCD